MEEKNKVALITGVAGQDGSYLSELLLSKGYTVHGIVRRTSSLARSRIDHLRSNKDIYNKCFFLHYLDLEDALGLSRLITTFGVSEIYHLAGQSHVGLSFEIPELTFKENIFSTLTILRVLKDLGRHAKFLHASSSEVFGRPQIQPQNEQTAFRPVTPYGCSKACSSQAVQCYRDSYGIYAINLLMFNHESPRRGENFVTRKVCRAAVEIARGYRDFLYLGDLSGRRDWGHAKDYVRAMWMAMQLPKPDDYLVATGTQHTVEQLVSLAFGYVNLDWKSKVKQDPALFRSSEPSNLCGDSTKIRAATGWQPEYTFEDIIKELVENEKLCVK